MIDAELGPTRCADCGQSVVLANDRSCPLCRVRDAGALEPGAVPAGPWPRLVLVRGEPLPGGALWVALPAGVTVLDLGDGPRASVFTDGRDGTLLVPTAHGLRVNGAEAAPGASVALASGARISVGGRELVRA